ncbi:hypothetical protein H4219_005947 [Mycoemilia scoparia]|uniref:PLC-like phosphodiesterase n=1 Tax=Mycoemilia scoparia TaxID=417184 RepID=A0A9W7ZMB9_9FUNG|nr:hypothetical protein H4219_005947 [Mycoemilia scoparia]
MASIINNTFGQETHPRLDKNDTANIPYPCNGYKSLCQKRYDQVSSLCTHNSFAYKKISPLSNQDLDFSAQLESGVRAFMLDLHKPALTQVENFIDGLGKEIFGEKREYGASDQAENNTSGRNAIHLCHANCVLLDMGRLYTHLETFKKFLDDNPREIITFIIENFDDFPATRIEKDFQRSGLDKYVFTPKSEAQNQDGTYSWDTLESMINADKRLVVFTDKGADTKSVKWLLPEWEYVTETPFKNIINKTELSCDADRPADHGMHPLYVLNHFSYKESKILNVDFSVPQPKEEVEKSKFNDIESFRKHISVCKQKWGDATIPNYLAVDWFEVGDGLQAVAEINGVSDEERIHPGHGKYGEADSSGVSIGAHNQMYQMCSIYTVIYLILYFLVALKFI